MEDITKYCPNCGQLETNLDVTKCDACGTLLDEGSFDERIIYLGRESNDKNTYLRIFDKIKANGKKCSWHWFGFLFPFYWFAYRKMYGWAAISFVGNIVCQYIGWIIIAIAFPIFYGNVGLSMKMISILLQLPNRVVFGVFTNYLYMKKIDKLVAERKQLPENMRESHEKKGGTNIVATIIAMVAVAAISAIL